MIKKGGKDSINSSNHSSSPERSSILSIQRNPYTMDKTATEKLHANQYRTQKKKSRSPRKKKSKKRAREN